MLPCFFYLMFRKIAQIQKDDAIRWYVFRNMSYFIVIHHYEAIDMIPYKWQRSVVLYALNKVIGIGRYIIFFLQAFSFSSVLAMGIPSFYQLHSPGWSDDLKCTRNICPIWGQNILTIFCQVQVSIHSTFRTGSNYLYMTLEVLISYCLLN